MTSLLLLAISGPAIWCVEAAARPADTASAPSATLTIHADQPTVKMSPMLFGIFFEEINCAGDGGLYAELVRNRSFEDADQPKHWELVTTGSARGEMDVDKDYPLSPSNPRSLRVKILDAADGRVSVVNEGYWGMALIEGAEYALSLYARGGDGFSGPLMVTLESAEGKVHAEGEIPALTSEWKPFALSLVSNATDPKARFVISAAKPGTVWLDMVSLFPKKTWKDRSNGLRPDLARMLADLRPSFVRFPGGCWVEGDTLEFAQRWKRTIGPLGDRRTQHNIWQYESTNGLGFHEYLQMCEDLGAEPLFVINCGMSHKENVPMDRMGEWVQDALDAIAYANGPADSEWGSLRAAHGRLSPFNLKLMEIGNENAGPAYQERYALFHDAIKARYPDIQLIADAPTEQRPADIVDEHYYSTSEFFIANAEKYDSYDRNGPRIYVGEYAVTKGCGAGNLRGALGEAAFMTGMERNSDVVIMASYAPLFANVNYKKWNPDLINFDSSRVYGTPSYYVQKLFSENRGDVVLKTEFEAPGPDPLETPRGAIGVGTWATRAEFKDIRVTRDNETLFASGFPKDLGKWKLVRGEWNVKHSALQQTSDAKDLRAVAGDPSWTDYTYHLKARKLGGREGFLILFQARDESNYAWWSIGGWGNVKHAVERCVNGVKSIVSNEVPGRIETDRWYDIRVEVNGDRVRCYLDGQLLHDVTYPRPRPLHAVASRAEGAGEVIVKMVNTSNHECDTQIELRGVQQVQPRGTVIVLTSADPEAENSLDEPTKVAPVTRPLDQVGSRFRCVLAPNSLTILRLNVAKR